MRSASGSATAISDHGPDRSARMAGAFLLLTAAATAVMVFTRVAADADQDTLLESLRAVDENRVVYGISGVARLLSGVMFFVAAWLLLQTWIIRDRCATPVVPYLFAISAVCTVISGGCAIFLGRLPGPLDNTFQRDSHGRNRAAGGNGSRLALGNRQDRIRRSGTGGYRGVPGTSGRWAARSGGSRPVPWSSAWPCSSSGLTRQQSCIPLLASLFSCGCLR